MEVIVCVNVCLVNKQNDGTQELRFWIGDAVIVCISVPSTRVYFVQLIAGAFVFAKRVVWVHYKILRIGKAWISKERVQHGFEVKSHYIHGVVGFVFGTQLGDCNWWIALIVGDAGMENKFLHELSAVGGIGMEVGIAKVKNRACL